MKLPVVKGHNKRERRTRSSMFEVVLPKALEVPEFFECRFFQEYAYII